jgi:hypothetical protein
LAILINKETPYENLIQDILENDDDKEELLNENYKRIYVLIKYIYLTSGRINGTRFNNLISALDCFGRRTTPSEWFRHFNIIHSGRELRNTDMDINQFIEETEDWMAFNENDWKPRSHSAAPDVNTLDDEES